MDQWGNFLQISGAYSGNDEFLKIIEKEITILKTGGLIEFKIDDRGTSGSFYMLLF